MQRIRPRDEAEVLQRSPSGAIACARTPEPPGARSSGWISGTSRCSDRQNSSRLNDRRSSYHAIDGYLPQETPEAAVGQRVEQVAGVEIGLAVALARERQHGVRPGFDAAVNQPREVHAQERETADRARGRSDAAPATAAPARIL